MTVDTEEPDKFLAYYKITVERTSLVPSLSPHVTMVNKETESLVLFCM